MGNTGSSKRGYKGKIRRSRPSLLCLDRLSIRRMKIMERAHTNRIKYEEEKLGSQKSDPDRQNQFLAVSTLNRETLKGK